jgi:tetratricopeptide (TPR) repeat protein
VTTIGSSVPNRPLASALAVAALLGAAEATLAPAAGPAFTREEYFELVRRYARGERAEAVAGLGAWSERDLARQLAGIEQAARALQRCPSCENVLTGLPLRAAVMLLWDRDRSEQPPAEGVEQLRRCPGPMAVFAGRLARVLAPRPEAQGFARRFFHGVTLSCQWDACFDGAERWAGEAIEIFPHDAELLLARGSVREEMATLGTRPSTSTLPREANQSVELQAAQARREGLLKARGDLEAALRLDPGLGLARVRLGRVLWQLGELEPARRELEAALPALGKLDEVYLAHLFLGRVHQDAGRLADATSEYRLATGLHPGALATGMALSNALWLAGDAEAARAALAQGLRGAGRRRERDPYWDYLAINAQDVFELFEALRQESLE